MAEAATVHQFQSQIQLHEVLETTLPLFIDVSEMNQDRLSQHRAGRFIGEVMLAQTVETAEVFKRERPIESLRDGIHWAAEGDAAGISLVETNVATDVIERTLKTGHVTDPIRLEATDSGSFVQYNQNTDSIYANSLQLAAGNDTMRARTEAETRNKFRVEDLYRAGYFEDYNLAVFSLADDLEDVFFTDTMSCSIQVLRAVDDGLELESAFVAGISEPGAQRHDLDTISQVGDRLGVDFGDKTPAQIIDTPVLIRKDQMPDGAINLVELWDAVSGTFFGENKPAPCSYPEYLQRCRERTKSFRPKVEVIRDQLISEAASITTRIQATERLHQLSEQHMVEKAIEDLSIDPRVFGPVSAEHIALARYYEEQGQAELATRATSRAIQTAVSKSCPSANNRADTGGDAPEKKQYDSNKDEFGSLTFNCTEGHENRRPRGKLILKCRVASCKGTVGC